MLDAQIVAAHQAAVDRALPTVDSATLSKTYVGFLGFYNSQGSLKWSKPHLVEVANRFSSIIGTTCVSIMSTTAVHLGLLLPVLNAGCSMIVSQ